MLFADKLADGILFILALFWCLNLHLRVKIKVNDW